MEDREDIHAVVKLLVARMQSNPEEFKFNPTGSLAITGRWERWIAQLGWHFNEAEKELIYGKAKELIFNRVHEEVMEELINGSDRKIEVPINTTSALQRQQAAMQLAQAQIAATNRSNRGGAGGGSGVMNSALQRAQLAQAFGIDPASPAGQKFALTGQLPASLSPTDKKAIQEADQMVMASQQGLSMLNQAKTLNPKAAGGLGMGTLAEIFAQIGDETALNTRDLENVLQSNVLPQLKAIFGGAPTEGERQILLDLQGSARKTVEERRRIIDRSIAAANARIGFYRDQAADLRGGTYYSPTRGQPPAAQPAAPAAPKKKTTLPNGVTIEELD